MSKTKLFRVLITFLVSAVLTLAASSGALAGEWTGDTNFILGQKVLNKTDWEPVENQEGFGAEGTWGEGSWPIQIATDFFGSYKEDRNAGITGKTSELGVGIRKIWGHGHVHPYLGGGAAFVYGGAELDFSGVTVKDSDTSTGAWAGGGVFWRLGSHFNLGLAARYSRCKVTLFDTDLEAGGYGGGLILGWGWPAVRKGDHWQ
jgi:opacity protein-like surface antigen